ncbi:carboxypeptidase-like regulatory domain-containing protein [uncultured Algibacter sp.]|uniref:carboxypeptidase-like regulatory domain-containing protein n=1 Tax=uncultured Algibacter sp. TaxID=298659 RepID=UPI00262D033A|nr:carboxypeptidase-like regulatory domain-containing protein [uncultured Algibacter sp.]
MKNLLLLTAFLFTVISFAQKDGIIKGNLVDLESNNDPLMFAKVQIKETGVETLSDENGSFQFKNLENGTYTLVYSFVGYKTEEKKVQVISGETTNIKQALAASSISLDELMLTLASVDKIDDHSHSTSSK